ncbi:MAG: clostripain-related cysteine peptidase [Syntrophomonadaceae bacterium]
MWKIAAYFLLALVSVSFFACRNISRTEEENRAQADSLEYRIVYYIHGDGSYLYHDNDGNDIQADERMVDQAISVAEALPNSEVFIFHQKSKKHFLFLFPLKDGEFYYFRNGQLIENESYNSNPSLLNLDIEAAFFREYASYVQDLPGKILRNFFLYYGHEIPETDGSGYNASYNEKPFSTGNLAKALSLFKSTSQMGDSKFDFLLLSTCYNGTPGVISQLTPYANYIMASPEYLHLSYISSEFLKELPRSNQMEDLHSYLKGFAENAFIRLKEDTRTMITIALYDAEKVKKFLTGYETARASNTEPGDVTGSARENFSENAGCVDCSKEKSFDTKAAKQGIDLFYNPPQFGKYKDKLTHSGWGCPK